MNTPGILSRRRLHLRWSRAA